MGTHWKWPCQALNLCWGIAPGPPVIGAALRLLVLTPLAIIIHNYFPPLRLGWLQRVHVACDIVQLSKQMKYM